MALETVMQGGRLGDVKVAPPLLSVMLRRREFREGSPVLGWQGFPPFEWLRQRFPMAVPRFACRRRR
jgi:hypothetical protein